MSAVLILNAGYEPMHHVSVEHAVRMLVRGVAQIEQADDGPMYGPWPKPKVLRLIKYVQMRWQHGRAPRWTKKRLFARDQHQCAYCGKPSKKLTVDHVVPKSRGGQTVWENTVAACAGPKGCNSRKGARTPAEANMVLRVIVCVPAWSEIL